MKRLLHVLRSALCISVCAIMGLALYLQNSLPDKYYITEGERFSIASSGIFSVSAVYEGSLAEEAYASAGNTYTVGLRLPGGISVKEVGVEVVDDTTVLLGGAPFGIKMFTDGVLVVGISDILSENGMACPARTCGLCEGDILHTVGGVEVRTNEDVSKVVSSSDGKPLEVVYTRGDATRKATLTAVKMADGTGYRAGLWVRDSSAGIGTITYYDPTCGVFAGLGHAVCDVDTGEIMPLMSGEIVGAAITGVVRGESGSPGELRGVFLDGASSGTLRINSQTGVYGFSAGFASDGRLVRTAAKQEIREGPATIVSTVSGSRPEEFDIVIEKVNLSDKNPTKNLVVRVTDENSLLKTGGIVQGMSGSPILQNGKLVGAVTHVFVNDPARGYGIFIENMLETSNGLGDGR